MSASIMAIFDGPGIPLVDVVSLSLKSNVWRNRIPVIAIIKLAGRPTRPKKRLAGRERRERTNCDHKSRAWQKKFHFVRNLLKTLN